MLLALPVRLHDIEVARPVDVVLESDASRAVGLEVLCGDDATRFLPLAAADVGADAIAVDSPLHLLDEPDLAFYRRRGSTLRSLRGLPVERVGLRLGVLHDLVVAADGAVTAFVVRDGETERHVPFEPSLRISPNGNVTAA